MAVTRITVLLAFCLTSATGTLALAQDIEERYRKSCAVCHAAGAAGAPKTGSMEAWQPRLEKGMDALVQSVETGLKAMPPKGMCFDCSRDEYVALIELMARPR